MGGRDQSVLRSLLDFHVAAGARLALRAAIPGVAGLVVACGLAASPTAAMHAVARALAGPPEPLAAGVVLAASLGLASWVGRRAIPGATGWLPHLPCTALARRRALAAALAVGQAPLASLVALSALVLEPSSVSAARVAGTLAAIAATSLIVLPVRRRAAVRVTGLAAACLGAWGSWGAIGASVLLLAVTDRLAGPLQPACAVPRARLPVPVPAAIALRAIGGELPAAWAAASLPLLAGAAFLRHNALPQTIVEGAVRLAGILALGAAITSLAGALALKRPAWPWLRSLPVSARTRVLWDAGLLAVFALPPLIGTMVLHGPALQGLGPVVLSLPWLALRGADAVRRTRRTQAPLLAEAAFAAGWIALVPSLAWLAVALTPWALHSAIRQEKRRIVHAWDESRQLPGGDSMAWSDR